jgi:twitching motility protein PilT
MTESFDDIDALVEQLGLAAGAGSVAPDESGRRLETLLAKVVGARGTDLLLVAGVAPVMKGRAGLSTLAAEPVLDGTDIEALVLPALPVSAHAAFEAGDIVDSAFRLPGLGRFRVNLHRERGRSAATIRVLPAAPPRLADLRLSPAIESLTRLPRGLVLVGGPTGSGKTTTVAALVDEINRRDARHIVTIEDPIEYEHPHRRSLVEQIEVGTDAPDFATALRSVVRQAPDVIVVGEMRDPETMEIALSAAETGHLVFSTVHTPDVASSIARIGDAVSPDRQPFVRQSLAIALAAVLVQHLLPAADGGRVVASELLIVGYGARQHVRRNALQHLHQEIAVTRRAGSHSLEESLASLVRQGHLGKEDAAVHARHPVELEDFLGLA